MRKTAEYKGFTAYENEYGNFELDYNDKELDLSRVFKGRDWDNVSPKVFTSKNEMITFLKEHPKRNQWEK